MIIIETSFFTKSVSQLIPDESYRLFQLELVKDPESGSLIKGSGGLRKIRWALPGRGKSGGIRVIYYWRRDRNIILLLLIYRKNEQDDLSNEQLKILKKLVEDNFDE